VIALNVPDQLPADKLAKLTEKIASLRSKKPKKASEKQLLAKLEGTDDVREDLGWCEFVWDERGPRFEPKKRDPVVVRRLSLVNLDLWRDLGVRFPAESGSFDTGGDCPDCGAIMVSIPVAKDTRQEMHCSCCDCATHRVKVRDGWKTFDWNGKEL
jgi:hypothetical protein